MRMVGLRLYPSWVEECHADTYDITPTTQITPRPDPPERTLGSRDQTHVEPPVRKRHMRTTRGFPLLDATPQECS